METLQHNGKDYVVRELADTVYLRPYKEGHSITDEIAHATRDNANDCWEVAYQQVSILGPMQTTEMRFTVAYTDANWPLEIAKVMAELDWRLSVAARMDKRIAAVRTQA